MPCNRIHDKLDDYLDGHLSTGASQTMSQHIERCLDCRATIDAEQALRAEFARFPIEGPNDGFFDRALETARRRAEPRPNRVWRSSFGGAIAAAALVVFVASFLFDPSARSPSAELPEVAIALAKTTPVTLVFATDKALRGARVSLQLPASIELAGYSGRRHLSWTTDLKAGNNVLELPLVALALVADEIVATLSHENGTKTFRLKIRVV